MTQPATLSDKDITKHPLLDRGLRKLARQMRSLATETDERFTLLDFAEIRLRATARDYVEADERADVDESSGTMQTVQAARELQRAAILYVHEALKACDIEIIKQWPEFDEMLRSLVTLSGDMP